MGSPLRDHLQNNSPGQNPDTSGSTCNAFVTQMAALFLVFLYGPAGRFVPHWHWTPVDAGVSMNNYGFKGLAVLGSPLVFLWL